LILLVASFSFFVSHLLIYCLNFNYLINYEQNAFALRLLDITLLSLAPIMLLSFYWLWQRIIAQNKIKVIIFVIFFSLLATASFYLTYPRADNYFNSKGYSVGISDLEAVKAIDANADKDYVVLANQQVSAAAVQRFGYDRYYNDMYFYPVPTGGRLYQYYLKMVYDYPSKNWAQKAMQEAGVERLYFVLNKYWWAFDKIKAEAKAEADSFYTLDQGNIYIFEYNK
jgi:hypothetical protein